MTANPSGSRRLLFAAGRSGRVPRQMSMIDGREISNATPTTTARAHQGSAWEVLLVFLRLGLTSFGGPIAHLGYFHDDLVVRRKWLEEKMYADLVALCQFLPGPASSKIGIAVGLSRAGYPGALAAWTGFTLPSAIALVLFAYGVAALGSALGSGWLHGLKVAPSPWSPRPCSP